MSSEDRSPNSLFGADHIRSLKSGQEPITEQYDEASSDDTITRSKPSRPSASGSESDMPSFKNDASPRAEGAAARPQQSAAQSKGPSGTERVHDS